MDKFAETGSAELLIEITALVPVPCVGSLCKNIEQTFRLKEKILSKSVFTGERLENWERAETPHGVPYYINHSDESTQWDHPVVEKLIEDLEDNNIKYAAYRTALKIKKIQNLLNLQILPFALLTNSFAKSPIFSKNKLKTITCNELQQFLSEIFLKVSIFDHELYAELLTNVLLNICDLCRKGGKVPKLYIKVYLTVLCFGKLPEKYKYMFSLFKEKDHVMSELGLTKLFHLLAEIPEFLFEGKSFGNKFVSNAVKSCMERAAHSRVFENTFLEWLLQEPQNLVWLSTLTRVTAAEREVLIPQATPKEETNAFLKTLRNILKKKHVSESKKRYMPIASLNSSTQTRDVVLENAFGISNSSENFSPDTTSKMLQTDDYLWEGMRLLVPAQVNNIDNIVQTSDMELESIIIHLEDENQNLLKEVELLNPLSSSESSGYVSNTSNEDQKALLRVEDIVQEHNHQVQVQVQRLRNLLEKQSDINVKLEAPPSSKIVQVSEVKKQFQSTPTSSDTHASFKNVSPIEAIQDSLNLLGQVTQSNVPNSVSSGDILFSSRNSLRRKVLQPKKLNNQTPHRSNSLMHSMKLGTSDFQSSYGFSDITVNVGQGNFAEIKRHTFLLATHQRQHKIHDSKK
ncbi:Dystrophin, isoform D [Nymphon striatum]|nr:Dystrophin, isoform D [Nymphon striatum]